MSIREKLRNPFVQQYGIEILFPILGYYLFDWSLVIIAIFYLIDQLSAELLYFRRIIWINNKSENPQSSIFILEPALIFFCLFTVQFLGIYFICTSSFTLEYFSENLAVVPEVMKFVVEELWFLFPLVVAVYYIKDMFAFYMPRRYLSYSLRRTINFRHLLNLTILISVFAFFSLGMIIQLNDHFVLFGFIVVKVIFDFTLVRWMNKKSLKPQ